MGNRPAIADPKTFIFHSSFYNTTGDPLSSSTSTSDWVSYKQCDPAWGNNLLGYCTDYTICTAGCAMSSVAMMLATRGVSVDPASLNDWLINNGGFYDGCGLLWAVPDQFGVTSFQGN